MTETLYAQNRELGFALTLIKHMSEHNLLIAERAIREARSRLTTERGTQEFDRKMAAGTL